MSNDYLYLNREAVELLSRFRSRWNGRTPKGNIEWASYDRDKNSVLAAVDPETRKRIEREPNAMREYRERFLRELAEGEPRDRVKGPTFVYGTQASSGVVDADTYDRMIAQRAADDGEE